MSACRFAATALVATLLFAFVCTTGWSGDGLSPAQRYLESVQKHEPLLAQKHVQVDPAQKYAPVIPAQKYEAFSVQKHVPMIPSQKYEAFPVQKYGVLPPQEFSAQKPLFAAPMKAAGIGPKIKYHHHRCCKRRGCCSCEAGCQILLPVTDPKSCTTVMIPVPAPPSCQGATWQKERPGLFCRGVSIFKWPCGYMVKVVLLHKGDAVVHTFGVPVHTAAYPVGPPLKPYVEPHSSYLPVPTPAPDLVPAPVPAPAPVQPSVELGPDLVPQGGYSF